MAIKLTYLQNFIADSNQILHNNDHQVHQLLFKPAYNGRRLPKIENGHTTRQRFDQSAQNLHCDAYLL